MQNMGLLMEYEDILLKKRKDFSATYIGQNASQKDIKELFQYVFENFLTIEVRIKGKALFFAQKNAVKHILLYAYA